MSTTFNASSNIVIGLNKEEVEKMCNMIIDLEIPQLDFEDKELGFEVMVETNIDDSGFIGDCFAYEYYDKGKHIFQTQIDIPYAYKNMNEFAEDLYFYLSDEFGFDMYTYGKGLGFTFEEVNVLFNIMHELSHMQQHIKELNKYGEFLTLEIESKDRFKIYENDIGSYESFIAYRKLPTEHYADKNAIYLLEKYGELFQKIMKEMFFYL